MAACDCSSLTLVESSGWFTTSGNCSSVLAVWPRTLRNTCELKQGECHQTWWEYEDPKQAEIHAKFQRPRSTASGKKRNLKFFVESETDQLSPLSTNRIQKW